MTEPGATDETSEKAPTVSWFELFYDLVVVAAIGLTNDVYLDRPSTETAMLSIITMSALAWVWFLTTLYNNLHPSHDLGRRFLMVVQMGLIAAAGLSVDQEHGIGDRAGLVAYGLALGIVVVLNLWGSRVDHVPASRLSTISIALAAAICVIGGLDDNFRARVYLVAALVVSMVPMLTRQFSHWRNTDLLRLDHLRERLGVFVLIVLGEGFVTLLNSLHTRGEIPRTDLFALLFLLAFAVWWIYFDGTFSHHTNLSVVRWRLSLLCHLTLIWGIMGMQDILVLLTTADQVVLADTAQWYFVLCLALVLFSFAGLTYTAKGRLGPQGWLQVGCAWGVVIVGGTLVPRADDYLYWVIGLCAAIVVVNAVVAVWMDHGLRKDRWFKDLSEALRGVESTRDDR